MGTINRHNYEAFLLDYLEGNLSEALRAELSLFAITHPELEIDLDDLNLPVFKADQQVPDLHDDFKLHLKKTELNFPDEELLNYLDNNLTEAEQKVVEDKLLKDKELAADFALYKKTILSPDPALGFQNKTSLLKTEDELFINNRALAYFENTLTTGEKTEFESDIKARPILEKELQLFSKTRLYPDLSAIYPDKQELKKENRVFVLFNVRTVSAMAAAILLLMVLGYVFNYFTSPGVEIKNEKNLAKKELPAVKANDQPVLNVATDTFNQVEQSEAAMKKQMAQGEKVKSLKPGTTQNVQAPAPEISPELAENKTFKQDQPVVKKETVVQEKELIVENKPAEKIVPVPESQVSVSVEEKQIVMTMLEESDDDTEETEPSKNGFWKKAVKLAKRANSLGVKSIDGVEKPHEGFALSFNAFSVEKH
ncbi:MAG: hypothetical protein V4635_09910 [Bacteroidota bacterium]